MPRKCRSCGTRIIEYPIWKDQEYKEPFAFNKIIWRNLLIGDWTKLLILITLIFVALSYGHDSKAYREIYSNPCNYVMKNIDACIGFNKTNTLLYIGPDLFITEFNQTEGEEVKNEK